MAIVSIDATQTGDKNASTTLAHICRNRLHYITRVVKTVDETCKLFEAGFEYVTATKGSKFYETQSKNYVNLKRQ